MCGCFPIPVFDVLQLRIESMLLHRADLSTAISQSRECPVSILIAMELGYHILPLLISIDEEELIERHVPKGIVRWDESIRILIQELCNMLVTAQGGLQVLNELVNLSCLSKGSWIESKTWGSLRSLASHNLCRRSLQMRLFSQVIRRTVE